MHLAATDPEKFKELGQPAVDYVRKLHTPQNHGAAWSKLIARAEAERNLRTYQRCHKHTIYKLVEGALTDLLGQRHKLPEVIDILVGHMRSKNPRQMLSAIRPQVRAICRSLGVQVVGKYQFDNYVRCVDER